VQLIKAIKLNKMPGENVEEKINLIRSSRKLLQQCSTDDKNFVPDDTEETALKVFQMSSLDEFNEIFHCEEHIARTGADQLGGMPDCPPVQETCSLALNSHR
jgi:hypothetical protein